MAKRSLASPLTQMILSCTVLPGPEEEDGDARVPGPKQKNIITNFIAVYNFSELKFAHEQESVNPYGVMKIAYKHHNLILGMSYQQGEDTT